MLGLYLYTLKIGHKSCNMLKVWPEIGIFLLTVKEHNFLLVSILQPFKKLQNP